MHKAAAFRQVVAPLGCTRWYPIPLQLFPCIECYPHDVGLRQCVNEGNARRVLPGEIRMAR